MDALQVLKQDHDKTKDLFEQFRSAAENENSAEMEELASQIFHELEVHTTIEERVFYPAVRDAGGGELDDLTDESNEEHHVVDLLIAEVKKMSPSDDRFKAKMTVMIENVEHHMSEEEEQMFPKVRELIDENRLQQLGTELEEEKGRAKSDSKSKSELYAEAQKQDVPGRSDMSKEELEDALSKEQS